MDFEALFVVEFGCQPVAPRNLAFEPTPHQPTDIYAASGPTKKAAQ